MSYKYYWTIFLYGGLISHKRGLDFYFFNFGIEKWGRKAALRSKISQLWSALQRILEDCPTPHPTSHHTPLPHPSPTPHPTQHPPHPHTPHPTTHPDISSPSGCCCRTTPGRSRGRSPPPPPPRIKGNSLYCKDDILSRLCIFQTWSLLGVSAWPWAVRPQPITVALSPINFFLGSGRQTCGQRNWGQLVNRITVTELWVRRNKVKYRFLKML